MKYLENRKVISNQWFMLIAIVFIVGACEFDSPLRDADYPDQLIYLPAAVGGNFEISDIARRIGDPPVPGNPYRYVVDLENRQFLVPLGVYRSGIDNIGAFSIDIVANNDTINDIITAGDTIISLLPQSEYTMVNTVEMRDGEELAKFDLIVDLDFLRENYPTDVYALGVTISSSDRETNPELSTAIIVIHTDIIKPTADFSFSQTGDDPITIKFLNNSNMALSYLWDFGDGSEFSEEEAPSHIYSNPGTYTVTLTAIGITGEEDQSVFKADVTI